MNSHTQQAPPTSAHVDNAAISAGDVIFFFLAGMIAGLFGLLTRYMVESARSAYQTGADEFQTAFDSTDLAILGTYLRGRLGSLTVRDYVEKSVPRERVDRYLMKLTEFVGSQAEEETNLDKPAPGDIGERGPTPKEAVTKFDVLFSEPPPDVVSVYRRRDREDDPPILVEARQMAEAGNIWTALATIRRDLEQRLRAVFDSKMIMDADVVRLFGPAVGRHYERFRRVANRAIHGDEVHLESARAALNSARVLYDALNLPQSELNL